MLILRNKLQILFCSSDDIVINLCLHERRYPPIKNKNSFTTAFPATVSYILWGRGSAVRVVTGLRSVPLQWVKGLN